MTPRCPRCENDGVVRHGSKTFRNRILNADGVVERTDEVVQRFRCRACSHVFVEAREPRREIDESIVAAALRAGISPTARRFGIDEASVSSMLAEWTADRDRDMPSDMPDVAVLTPTRIMGREAVIVSDPIEQRLLDIMPSAASVAEWMADTVAPKCVVVEIDGPTLSALEEAGLGAKIVVAPRTAGRAIESAALMSFRAIVRNAETIGRNCRERTALLRRPDADLTDEERNEIAGWHPGIRRFRFAVLTLLTDLASKPEKEFAVTMSRVVATMAECAPASPLHRLLTRWRDAIVRGTRFRWTDRTIEMVAALRSEIRKRKPTASIGIIRAILLHADRDRAAGHPDIVDAIGTLRAFSLPK